MSKMFVGVVVVLVAVGLTSTNLGNRAGNGRDSKLFKKGSFSPDSDSEREQHVKKKASMVEECLFRSIGVMAASLSLSMPAALGALKSTLLCTVN